MKNIAITNIEGYLTNIDKAKTPSNYASDLRGWRQLRSDIIAERDLGTLNRYATPPIRPNPFTVITGAASNGAPNLIRINAPAHGLLTGDIVDQDEIVGTVEAVGKWVITKYDTNYYDLVGSVFTHAYTSGGIATKIPITVVAQHNFVDADGTEYDIVVGLDSNNKTRIYVYDPASTEASKWIELTRFFTAAINDTPGATDKFVSYDNPQENGVTHPFVGLHSNAPVLNTPTNGETDVTNPPALHWTQPTQVGSSEIDNYVLVNKTKGQTVFIPSTPTYHVQIATDAGFTNIVADIPAALTPTATPSALAPDTEHFWRVAANVNGVEGDFSPPWSFTTIMNDPTPTYYADLFFGGSGLPPTILNLHQNTIFTTQPWNYLGTGNWGDEEGSVLGGLSGDFILCDPTSGTPLETLPNDASWSAYYPMNGGYWRCGYLYDGVYGKSTITFFIQQWLTNVDAGNTPANLTGELSIRFKFVAGS